MPLLTASNPEFQLRDQEPPSSPFPPEFDLLLCCARSTLDPATAERLTALVSGGIDWPNFVSLAVAHGVVPLVYQTLKSAKPGTGSNSRPAGIGCLSPLSRPTAESTKSAWPAVPAPQQKQLRDYTLANAQNSLRLTAELLRLVELFEARHIPVIPFKGPALAASLYGSPAMRQFGDLDLLVHEGDVKKAKDLLLAEGYRCQFNLTDHQEAAFIRYECELAFTAKPGPDSAKPGTGSNSRPAGIGCLSPLSRPPLSPNAESTPMPPPLSSNVESTPAAESKPLPSAATVEIHWRLAPRHFRYPFDAAAIWRRAVPATVAGRPMLSFHPEDLFLFLCLHGAKHLWTQLKWICDVAEFIRQHPNLDWDALLARSRRQGCERILLLALHLANDLWGRFPTCGRFPIGPLPDHLAKKGTNPNSRLWGRFPTCGRFPIGPLPDHLAKKGTNPNSRLWGRFPTCGRFPIGPPPAHAKSSQDPAIRNLSAEVYQRLATPAAPPPDIFASLSFHLKTRERLRDKLRHAVLLLATPKAGDWEWLPLPPMLFPIYYLLHPFRMIRTHGGQAWSLIERRPEAPAS